MKRLIGAVPVVAIGLLIPSPVLAHGLVGRVQSPLPLAVYLAGAALAVGLSFLFVAVRDLTPPATGAIGAPRTIPRWLVIGLRAVGLIAWAWIVAQTIAGGSSDADVSSLFLWVYGWVGLALLSALLGPVWSWLDPFSTLYDMGAALLRAFRIEPWEPAAYPRRLGTWPALVGFVFFVWLELVLRIGNLGFILIGYTVVTLLAMAQFGRDEWRRQGETFSVWFATLGRMAPFAIVGPMSGRRVIRRPYLAGLIEGSWEPPTVVLVAVGTASILFDGLSPTQPWFDLFGLPALGGASFLLAGFLGLVVGVVWLVTRLVGWAALGAGLVPIATGYILAHYLTYVLGDGQRIVIALSDPLQLGWDLIGMAFYEPGTDWIPPGLLWTVQLAAVVGGHIFGIWAGHVVAVRHAPRGTDMRWRQVPLAALMVALTATTLWSLGQAVVDDSPPERTAFVEPRHG